ncbi:hypothetical protein SAMN06265222_101634 [Neorhodopirellula lusitana]|uniref:Uncharacterized protein n=1 Tax=Neorhodopirellula lusitana TaxID=445327 RepID=A0ABY1PQ20_9BACT|nr:hypothetical protein SAMN06265222_101634 [Neorhodopirellula lusitana]
MNLTKISRSCLALKRLSLGNRLTLASLHWTYADFEKSFSVPNPPLRQHSRNWLRRNRRKCLKLESCSKICGGALTSLVTLSLQILTLMH